MRVLSRAALSVVQPGEGSPEHLSKAVRGLATATGALATYLQTSSDPEDTRQLALEAAREASVLLNQREDLAVNALVDQIHSSAVDLLGSTGLDRGSALQALEQATGRAS